MAMTDLWTLLIEHDYYLQKKTQNIDIEIATNMRTLLRRRDLVFRRKLANEWCLSYSDSCFLSNDDMLEVEIVQSDNNLLYITDLEWPTGNNCYEVGIPAKNSTLVVKEYTTNKVKSNTLHCILKLQIPIGRMKEQEKLPVATTLVFETTHKYWEYIFLSRQSAIQSESLNLPQAEEAKKVLRLEDLKNTISFAKPVPTEFMGHQAYKIRSLNKLPSLEKYQGIDLVLWETILINNVEKEYILLCHLPFPDSSLKLGTDPDTAWKVIYY